ncbi:MAG: hypothetical protein R8M45_11570 [Ghiorsea sp.]
MTDIVNPPTAANWFPVLQQDSISAVSHTLDPISGISTVGGVSFSLVDVDSIVSKVLRDAGIAGYGTNRQLVDVYMLQAGDDWADAIRMRRTQIASAVFDAGVWKFTCQDAFNSIKKEIFNMHKGVFVWESDLLGNKLTVDPGGDPAKDVYELDPAALVLQLKISRVSESSFPLVWGLSFIRIDDEVFRVDKRVHNLVGGVFFSHIYLEVSRTSFDWTGNSLPVAHKNGAAVSEIVNIVAEPLRVYRGLLTGNALRTENAKPAISGFGFYAADIIRPSGLIISDPKPFPVGHHTVSFTAFDFFNPAAGGYTTVQPPQHWQVGIDWVYAVDHANWDAVYAASAPVVFDFIFEKSISAKLFMEREILRPMGLFMGVSGSGKLQVHEYKDLYNNNDVPAGAQSHGGYETRVLDEDNAVSWSAVETLRSGDIITSATLSYDRSPRLGGKFTRAQVFTDTVANTKHGDGRDFAMQSDGIFAGDTDSVERVFTKVKRVLARFANPPLRLQVSALGTTSPWEVGDVIRAKLPIADPSAVGSLNRCFEIVKTSLSPSTGSINYSLIAQSDEPDVQTFRLASSFADSVFLNNQTLAAVTANAGGSLNIVNMAVWGDPAQTVAVSGDWYLPSALPGTQYTIQATLMLSDTVRIFSNAELIFAGTVNGVGGATFGAQSMASSGGKSVPAEIAIMYRVDTRAYKYGVIPQGCDAGTYHLTETYTSSLGLGGGTDYSPSFLAIDVTPTTLVAGLATNLGGVPAIATGGTGDNGASITQTAAIAAAINMRQKTAPYTAITAWSVTAQTYAAGVGGRGGAGLVVVSRKISVTGSMDVSGTNGTVGSSHQSATYSTNNAISCDDHAYAVTTTSDGAPGGGGSIILIAEADPTKGISRTGAAIKLGDPLQGSGIIREILI